MEKIVIAVPHQLLKTNPKREKQNKKIGLEFVKPVMRDMVTSTLEGIVVVSQGPTTVTGTILTTSILFSLANCRAAWSARVFDT